MALIVKSRVRALLMLRGKSKAEFDELVERFSGNFLNRRGQEVRVHRLREEAGVIRQVIIGGDDDDANVGPPTADYLGKLEAVELSRRARPSRRHAPRSRPR